MSIRKKSNKIDYKLKILLQVGRLYYNKSNPTGCSPDKIFTDVFNSDPD